LTGTYLVTTNNNASYYYESCGATDAIQTNFKWFPTWYSNNSVGSGLWENRNFIINKYINITDLQDNGAGYDAKLIYCSWTASGSPGNFYLNHGFRMRLVHR
jgi:hypothetical protein